MGPEVEMRYHRNVDPSAAASDWVDLLDLLSGLLLDGSITLGSMY